jgi:hypothetical protein
MKIKHIKIQTYQDMRRIYLLAFGLFLIVSNTQAQIDFTQTSNTFDNMKFIYDIDTGDVEGDGDLDVIIMGNNGASNVTEIYLNDGSGNYSILSGTNLPYYAGGGVNVKLVDIEGDNDMDVVLMGLVTSPSLAAVADLYRNDGGSTFTKLTSPFTGAFDGSIIAGDVDGDNDMDIFIQGQAFTGNADRNCLYKNDGSGNFTKVSISTAAHTSGSSMFRDVDNDNDLDLFIFSQNKLDYFENDGAGNFTELFFANGTIAGNFTKIGVLDIDGDNDLDLIAATPTITRLFTYDGKNELGYVVYTQVSGTSFVSGSNAPDIATGDFDGDGDEDIYLVSYSSGAYTGGFYFNDGYGRFYLENPSTFSLAAGVTIVANITGDSKPDLLTADFNNHDNLRLKTNISTIPSYALTLDGTNYYTAPHLSAWNTLPLTVEFKIKVPASTTEGNIILKGSGSSMRVRVLSSKLLLEYAGSGGTIPMWLNGNINDDNWHHIAIVVENSGATAYIDGLLNNTAPWNGTPGAISSTDNLVIGGPAGVEFNGALDELRVWSSARSLTEIVNNMCGEIANPPSEANLITYYKMNEYFGDTSFVELSSNANTMTINSSTLTTEAKQTGCTPPALPVELTTFQGRLINKAVHLTWQTASEENNEGFEIERSSNGQDWEIIGFVQGNGTTMEVFNYEFIDNQPSNGTNYYRLKQLDYDGSFEYSDVLNIEYRTRNIEYRIFPNPANDFLTIEIEEPTTFQILNAQGQEVLARTLDHTENIDIAHLPAGIYWVKILNNNTSTSQSLVIQ